MHKRPLTVISPMALMTLIWSITLVIGLLPVAFPDTFPLVFLFIRRQGISLDDFTTVAALWQILMFVLFWISGWVTLAALPSKPKPFDTDINFASAARFTFSINVVLLGVTLLWLFVSAQHMGGLRGMMILAQLDPDFAREVLKENTLFPGMRMFYGAMPGTGAVAAALLAAGTVSGKLPTFETRLMKFLFILNLILLVLLPIVMSQRLLLLQMILASYFAVCVIHRKIVGIPYISIGAVLFLASWVLRESVSNPTVTGTALQIGFQKLVFYFTNDLLNAFMPFTHDTELTYGYFSLNFLMAFTFTDEFFTRLLTLQLELAEDARGGGLWSIFSMPYVDFGPIGAAIFLIILSVLISISFHKSTHNVFWAILYGNVAAGLMLSTHLMHFAIADFHGAVIINVIVAKLAARRNARKSTQVLL